MSRATLDYQEQFLYGLTTFKEIGIAQFILIKANAEGVIFWPYEKIARYCKTSIRSVQSTYKKLIQAGKIRKTGMYKGKTKRIPVYEVLKNNGERCANPNQAKTDTITPKELYIEKKEKGGDQNQNLEPHDPITLQKNSPDISNDQKEDKKPWSIAAEKIFNEKFRGRDISISEMFAKCAIYRARKDGSVSDRDFQRWIIGTDIDKYKKKVYQSRSTVKEFQIIGTYSDVDREISAKARLPWIASMRSMLGL